MPPAMVTDPANASPITAVEYEPAQVAFEQIFDDSNPASSKWAVGTLTYTTGGLIVLFTLLLCGDFAYAMRERSVGPVVQLMLKRLNASDTLMAFLFSTLPTALSLIISPIVSYRSDHFRSRWGRRIPFLLAPTPIAAGAMIGIAYTEDIGSWLQHFLHLGSASQRSCSLASFGVMWTLFEVAAVVAGAVLGGLINDVVPRRVLGRFFGMFRQVSLGAGIIFNYWIFKQAETHYKAIFIGIGLLFFFGFAIMCLTVREGEYPPAERASAGDGSRLWNATRTYFRQCFKLSYYRWMFAGLMFAAATFMPVNLFSLLYAKKINMSDRDVWSSGGVLLCLFVSIRIAARLVGG